MRCCEKSELTSRSSACSIQIEPEIQCVLYNVTFKRFLGRLWVCKNLTCINWDFIASDIPRLHRMFIKIWKVLLYYYYFFCEWLYSTSYQQIAVLAQTSISRISPDLAHITRCFLGCWFLNVICLVFYFVSEKEGCTHFLIHLNTSMVGWMFVISVLLKGFNKLCFCSSN